MRALADVALLPLVSVCLVILKIVRRFGIDRLPATRAACRSIGVYPLLDHYYEPLFNPKSLEVSLLTDRSLAAVDLNVSGQLDLLHSFDYNEELLRFPQTPESELGYHYQNGMFESGDSEYLYSLIRLRKPRRMYEIGSGHSTRIAAAAIEANRSEDPNSACQHVCIEPYEASWLENLRVSVIRTPVEKVDVSLFDQLESGDILFIDSSHMIRPQGDVLCEYLDILPRLKSGVLIHVHDIFTPRDYPAAWITDEVRFWNEQYLLEAFLSYNHDFRIIGALNFLRHNYPAELSRCFPVIASELNEREPGSFWMERV